MGRARKPVAEQTKNLTVAEKKQRQFEEQLATSSRSDLSTPPDWLIDDLAVNEWNRLVKEISGELELIGNLDVDNLGGFCNAFAMYVKVTNELRNAQLLTIIGDGKIAENPLINTQRKYAEEMRKFGRPCGLTITSRSDLSTPPDWLIDDLAVNEWNRLVKEIEELELIGNLDINNLGGFCNAFAMYVKVTNELRNAQLLTILGDGKIIENPLINTQKKYAEEMRKFGRLCGLTIDSRLKFAAEKAKTIDNDIEEEFGDI